MDFANLLQLKPITKNKDYTEPGTYNNIKDLHNSRNSLSMKAAHTSNLIWVLSRPGETDLYHVSITPDEQNIPIWSAFNAKHRDIGAKFITEVGYCPMINKKSTDPSTVYTVMTNLQLMMTKMGQKCSVLTFNWAIYHIAKKIQIDRPQEFKDMVIRLGGFHVLTTYMAAQTLHV
jgi:hypothetical protein